MRSSWTSVGPPLHRGRRRHLIGQWVGGGVEAAQPVAEQDDRAPAERGGVLPALPEHGLDVVDRRAGDRSLEIVPGRRVAVLLCHGVQRLRVTAVVAVVATRVAQVDPADVRDVATRVFAVPNHDELLVVRSAGPHAHVEDRLGTTLLQGAAETEVLIGA